MTNQSDQLLELQMQIAEKEQIETKLARTEQTIKNTQFALENLIRTAK